MSSLLISWNTKTATREILAAGVALMLGYTISFICTILVDSCGWLSGGRSDSGRRLRDAVSRHLYVFGIGCMLSVCTLPGLHGAFHAVLAWITLVLLILMHIVHIVPCEDSKGIWRNGSLTLYYISCLVWYIGIVASFFKESRGY